MRYTHLISRSTTAAAIAVTLFQALVVDIAAQSLDPNEVRTQLSQSGLSESEIRQRLQAAGYSSQVLDLFLSDQPLDEMRLREKP